MELRVKGLTKSTFTATTFKESKAMKSMVETLFQPTTISLYKELR